MTRHLRCLMLVSALAFSVCGCATRGIVDRLTPETMTVGLSAPNLFSGPIVANRGDLRNGAYRFGQMGATVTFTYRLKPLRVERAQVQPVRVVPAVASSSPQPNP